MNEHMNFEDFKQNWPTIAAEVHTILKSKRLRKRVSSLQVYCNESSALLAEVVRTTSGAVVVTFQSDSAVLDVAPLTDDPAQTFPLAQVRGCAFTRSPPSTSTHESPRGTRGLRLSSWTGNAIFSATQRARTPKPRPKPGCARTPRRCGAGVSLRATGWSPSRHHSNHSSRSDCGRPRPAWPRSGATTQDRSISVRTFGYAMPVIPAPNWGRTGEDSP